jgi:hypothetical protein
VDQLRAEAIVDEERTVLKSILERVEMLKRQNRKLKRIGAAIAIAASMFLLMGQAQSNRKVDANEFVLRDGAGKVRARLYMDHGGPSLSLYDASDVEREKLTQTEGAAGLILYNNPPERFGGAEILLTADGPTLLLNSTKYKGLVALSTSPHGPALDISDSEGYKTTVGVSDTYLPQTGDNHKTSAAAITLFGKDGKVIWTAP